MKFSLPSSVLLLASSVSSAAVRRHQQSCGSPSPGSSSKGLYFLDNNPSGSSIISLQIASDGTLSNPIRTPTGGNGSIGLTANGPAETDSLFSQDSVVVSGNHLFTVNAGSNTLSHFLISPSSPQNLTLASPPIATLGTFPNSVAFSPKLNLICVLHTGSPSPGVSCFKLDPQTNTITSTATQGEECLLTIPLPSINQTNPGGPPTGPVNTASDILFNPSSTHLYVTTKGDPSTNTSGSVFSIPMVTDSDTLTLGTAAAAVRESKPESLLLEFSMTFLNDSAAVITDPSFGAALVDTSSPESDAGVTLIQRTEVANQTATCWSVYSNSRQEIYLSDTGTPDVTVLDAGNGEIKRVIKGPEEGKGSLDSVLLGNKLYVLQAGSGISVLDVDGGLQEEVVVQSLDLSGLGDRRGWMGMAVYRGDDE
ncbi:putative 3-carboxymuconate cyclase protein [Cladorrhinum sp. PSN332]|nr:putative 3-carboxymuconate cyclase protein [Cladorrhinum sp. PSN332]